MIDQTATNRDQGTPYFYDAGPLYLRDYNSRAKGPKMNLRSLSSASTKEAVLRFLIFAFLVMLVIIRIPAMGVLSHGGSFRVNNGVYKNPGNSSASSLDRTFDLSLSGMQSSSLLGRSDNTRASSLSSSAGTAAEQRIINNDPDLAPIPIYLHDHSSGGPSPSVVIGYGSLASIWDRTTTYDDILHRARNMIPHNDLLHRHDDLLHQLRGGDRNVTTIFHTSPKMASSTLRKACMDAQLETCNHLKRNEKRKTVPEGYRTTVRLTQLFEECPSTRHFCVQGKIPIPLTQDYTEHYGSRTFLHIFPFRMYDEWARSALHQMSYRGGEAECCLVKALLDDCQPHVELDLDRYTKSTLAIFVRSYVHLANITRGDIVSDRHRILLYNYRYLDETMASLSGLDDDRDGGGLGVPRLPGTERKINSANATLESGLPRVQQGPCADESRMMEKFHRCFSDKLPLY